MVTGKGNYTGTVSTTFKINPASISDATISVADQSFTGDQIKPEITATLGDTKLEKGTDYTVSFSDNTNIGTATVVITGKGNYTDSASTTFEITPADISKATISVADQSFTGSQIEPEVTVTLGDTGLEIRKDFNVSYSNNINAGEATVKITGTGNYTGTASTTFKINPADISNASISVADQTFTGHQIKPEVTAVLGNTELEEDKISKCHFLTI
jgi:hypothetical protein